MRLMIATAVRRMHGGVEMYLQQTIAALSARGVQVALFAERDGGLNRTAIQLPPGVPAWSLEESGREGALRRAQEFAPDIIFCHRLEDLDLERAFLQIAPGVFFAHNYYGTCISGTKTRSFPHPAPCPRIFGAACLAQYFPRRCGGLNPATMLRLYAANRARLELLRDYAAVLTNSDYLRDEYRRHGINARAVPLFAPEGHAEAAHQLSQDRWRLLFAGRMEKLKGGALLLDAAVLLRRRLDRDLHLTFAGDGPERSAWQTKARSLPAGIQVEFAASPSGAWLSQDELAQLYAQSHLLIMPSLWPEPFGLTGIEAGMHFTPAVAFPVGGIPQWMHDGENGVFAGLPASPESLAEAIAQALQPQLYPRLRGGAHTIAQEFSVERHCTQLEAQFAQVLSASSRFAARPDEPQVSLNAGAATK
jgi:glycosyltransferase involved in cell wall biosynthesis